MFRLFKFSDWSILAKVTAASLITLVTLLSLTFIAWQTLRDQRSAIVSNYNELVPVVERAYAVSYHLADVESNLYQLATWRRIGVTGQEIENILRTVEYNLQRVETHIVELVKAELPGSLALLEVFRSYRYNAGQTLLLILKDPDLGILSIRGGDRKNRDIERQAAHIARIASERFATGASLANKHADRLSHEFLAIAVLTGLIATAISIAAARAIMQPISDLVATIRGLKQGDLTRRVPWTRRRDEIGSIAHSVRDLQIAMLENRQLAEDRVVKQAELEHAATHDGLTGLANRPAFDAFLAHMFAGDRRGRGNLVYLLIDLDGFKPINDAYGHGAGDAVLVELAKRFTDLVRHGDLVARLGGDEFGLLFPSVVAFGSPETLARRVLAAIAEPIEYMQGTLNVGASIGVVCAADVEGGPEELVLAADQAMYLAKEQRQQSFVRYTPDMTKRYLDLHDRKELERAIAGHEFQLQYLPVVCLGTGNVVSFEAHPVWKRPDGGIQTGEQFEHRLEHFSLKRDFAFEIFRQAVENMKRQLREGIDPVRLIFKGDPTTLSMPGMLEDFAHRTAEFPKLTELLTLDLRGDIFVSRGGDIIRENVRGLAKAGLRISMDNFGQGYSSLQQLQDYEINELKLPAAFVGGIGTDRSSEVIIEGTLGIADGLGIDIIAKGIETEAQRKFLLERGCRFGEGPLFGGALSIDQIIARMRNSGRAVLAG
ncbi:putative bifunctional diguanylate cyclase/phosphodiesterase [Stappia sp.]|uniref:putative bifunctional diguanylate cyclase/phosphodiesterase n=1 Tax=Stappia sp. TaxID=1870903 RepID=UPI003A995CF6